MVGINMYVPSQMVGLWHWVYHILPIVHSSSILVGYTMLYPLLLTTIAHSWPFFTMFNQFLTIIVAYRPIINYD